MDMARMTTPLATEASTATRRPRSSGLGIAAQRRCLRVKVTFQNSREVLCSSTCEKREEEPAWLRDKSSDLLKPNNFPTFPVSPPTFTDRRVVAPLGLPVLNAAVDLLAADQLVTLSAPEGQHATDRHACAALYVEGAPAWRQDGDAGQA